MARRHPGRCRRMGSGRCPGIPWCRCRGIAFCRLRGISRLGGPAAGVLEELERNTDATTAPPLKLGTPVRGYLGRRQAAEVGDVDYYAFEVAGSVGEKILLAISLAPLPNIPLCLEISRDGREPLG